MTNAIATAIAAALGGLIVGALEELRARRRQVAADADHRRRQLEVLDVDREMRAARRSRGR